mmetsp:Transcript_48894/g.150949  ORF Transcript_48894/g.150949 Transcript_48894/m.150949 type:complete len:270 (-) Transcript_48894:102-911(-)
MGAALCCCCLRFGREWHREREEYRALSDGRWLDAFGTSSHRCLKDGATFAVFRFVAAIMVTGIVGWSWQTNVQSGQAACWPIFLTHWNLFLQVLYCWLAFWTSRQVYLMESGSVPKLQRMPFYDKAAWALQDVNLPSGFSVVVLFWLLLAPAQDAIQPSSVFTHGVSFAILLLDFIISGRPYYLPHALLFSMVAIAYLSFSLVWYGLGGTDCQGNPWIYEVSDWRQPFSVGTCAIIGIVVVAPILNLMMWFAVSQCCPWSFQEVAATTI